MIPRQAGDHLTSPSKPRASGDDPVTASNAEAIDE